MLYPSRAVQKLFRGHHFLLISSAAVMLTQVGLLVLLPLPIRAALDRLTGTVKTPAPWGLTQGEFLVGLVGSALLMGLLGSALEYIEDRGTALLARKMVTTLRTELIRKVLSRRLTYLDRKRKIDLLGRISGDAQNLELYGTTMMSAMVRSVPTILFVLAAMFYLQWHYALIIVILMSAIYSVAVRLAQQIKKSEKKYRHHTTALEHELLQTLNAMPLIKSLQGEERTHELLSNHQQKVNAAYDHARHSSASLNTMFSSGKHVIRTIVILLGGWAILHGQLTLGSLFAFITYLEALNKPVLEIVNYFSRVSKASASLDRILELEQELPAAAELSGTEPLNLLRTGLSFQKVQFQFADGSLILPTFDLELREGLIALVGESGVGKSTLIRLFNRLMDPSEGVIRLDGLALPAASLNAVRRHICVVAQEPFLLACTLRQNLGWAVDAPLTDQELWTALHQAAAVDFVNSLDLGLDTPIGEGGLQLSGGQAKRISLARGFLRAKIADILVFDEPTSGLDPLSAQSVMASLAELAKPNRLVLFSTHRMSEILLADKVLYLQKSEPPRFGRHDELQAQSPEYGFLAQELIGKEAR